VPRNGRLWKMTKESGKEHEECEVEPDGASPQEAEVIPPSIRDGDEAGTDFLALILNHYTERPDLLIKLIEEHDPGFIKDFNADARDFQRKNRESRYRFAKNQAYLSLILRTLFGSVAMLGFIYAVHLETATFGLLCGFALILAVSQGGSKDFSKIINALAKRISGEKEKDQD